MYCEILDWECPNRNSHCGVKQSAYVYGLYDPRIDDMFYIGSTIWPARRYSDHVHASSPGNFREAWIMSILADGSQPLFYSLHEFRTACEQEIKETEHEIARAWRAQGHTAICDLIPGAWPEGWSRHAVFPVTGWTRDDLRAYERQRILYRNHIAEYLDLVNEQARTLQWLRSF